MSVAVHPWAVPVTVNSSRPRSALGRALKVSVEVEWVGLGEKRPVTPEGRLETLNRTFPENPGCLSTSTSYSTRLPRCRLALSGVTKTENVRGVTAAMPEAVYPPPRPVTVNSSRLAVVLQLVAIVSTDVQFEDVTVVREKDPLRPVPRPETLSWTFLANPFCGWTSTV